MITRRQLIAAATASGTLGYIRPGYAKQTKRFIAQGAHLTVEVPTEWQVGPGIPGSITAIGGESGFFDAWPLHADSLDQAREQLARVFQITLRDTSVTTWQGHPGLRGQTASSAFQMDTTSLIIPNPNPMPTIDGDGTFLHLVGRADVFDSILDSVTLGIEDVSSADLALSIIQIVQGHSYFREGVNWEELIRLTGSFETHAEVGEKLPSRMAGLLREAGDKHSFYYDMRSRISAGTPVVSESLWLYPTGYRIGETGYLALPTTNGPTSTYLEEYATRGSSIREQLHAEGVCGWIIDLRPMSGGSIRPTLSILAPFLPSGPIAGFIDVEGGERWVENTDTDDASSEKMPKLNDSTVPVAVLTGYQTGSAGEFTLLALKSRENTKTLGSVTAGYTTGNTTFHLFDGQMFALATTATLDVHGNIYTSNIEPDIVNDVIGMSGGTSETTLAPALNWLSQSCPYDR